MNCIIGLDIGTTSTKAIAFDRLGKIISQKAIKYPVYSSSAIYSEQDPDEIFTAVLNTIKEVWGEIKNNYSLDGICFSSAMHGVMPVNTNGIPLNNCIIWADTRSKEIALRIKAGPLGNYIYQRTGTPIHPMSPLCKIIWIKENMPQIFKETYKFISFKEYVFYKLFGEYLVDYSIASCTGLFDIYDLKWNAEALLLAGIDEKKLAAPVPTSHIETRLAHEYATYLNLPEGTPFIVGASDGCLANLGSNAISKGHAAVTIGTSGAIRMTFKNPVEDPQARIFNYILSEDYYVAGGPVNNGGIILQWFLKNLCGQSLTSGLQEIEDYTLDLQSASLISAGADGLVFLPYLLGERAPHWDAEARGVFFGLNIRHTKAHMIKAIMEGIIYGIYSVAEALEITSDKIEVIYANGGFAKSKEWVQILSDVFGKNVLVSESVESSAWGAAIMGMHSLGIIADLDDQSCFNEKLQEFIPNQLNYVIYKKAYEIFGRVYEKLKDEFLLLNTLQE